MPRAKQIEQMGIGIKKMRGLELEIDKLELSRHICPYKNGILRIIYSSESKEEACGGLYLFTFREFQTLLEHDCMSPDKNHEELENCKIDLAYKVFTLLSEE